MTDRLARIQLIDLEVTRLACEGREATDRGDLERLKAINAELTVLRDSAIEIRREQLLEKLGPSKPERRRRWWRPFGKGEPCT